MARNPDDVYRIVIDAKKYPGTACNVIARVGGEGARAVIGAHYDTAPLVQGAGDDGSGTVMILELARLLKDVDYKFPLDIVAFSAEEYISDVFPPGSGDYVKRHAIEGIRWFMNFDDFGHYIGENQVQVGFPELLPPFTTRYPTKPYTGGGDEKAFNSENIPTFWYYTEEPFRILHTAEDSIDKMDFNTMAEGVLDALNLFKQLMQVL